MELPTSAPADTTSMFVTVPLATEDFGVPTSSAATEAVPAWVEESLTEMSSRGKFLAFEESGRRIVMPLRSGRSRIGRSVGAQVRFDDSSVSRRHAVITTDETGVRILDDRSLNGVHVNGQRVQSAVLHDGDCIGIGRHFLWFIDNALVGRPQDGVPAIAGAAGQ